MILQINELFQSLKELNIKPIYLIKGNQDYLIQKIRNKFLSLIPESERTMNYANYDMETTNISNAVEDAMSLPFFGEKRLVIVNNPYFLTGNRSKEKINQDIDSFVNYVNSPQNSTIMLIIAPYDKLDSRKKITKTIKKNSEIIDLSNMSDSDIKNYLKSKINNNGYTIDNEALNQLIQRTSNDLSSAMSELSKLFLYCYNQKSISVSDVNNVVTKSLDQNVFDLVNYVINNNINESINLYHDLINSSNEPLQINAILLSQFRLLIQVKIMSEKGYSQGKLASKLRIHPYRIKLALQKVKNYNYKKLSIAYLGLVDIESQMKSTQKSADLLFEMFMIKFVN
ncbi:DNA polymerase III subunit delta [Apilactobacillus timberlakei]|uniref:DNA polymerase III subunit delta n=1 Tax=Apilactobacillus timberlakei TaxID=2008380 RepID=UPI0011285AEF|nr:DNA polymerase III subunit delta [Apilactobacillus timberlakei]TPR21648.1 DNA polymerase III subunit delta [Apilactobacillus timberlakei]TPR22894.1 DNA polymerase III subunit delta [Apilactobacillus timberlakei]TPR23898.1 DNA polymerase III subunit delta [Apilactobacillus timberlakei]